MIFDESCAKIMWIMAEIFGLYGTRWITKKKNWRHSWNYLYQFVVVCFAFALQSIFWHTAPERNYERWIKQEKPKIIPPHKHCASKLCVDKLTRRQEEYASQDAPKKRKQYCFVYVSNDVVICNLITFIVSR